MLPSTSCLFLNFTIAVRRTRVKPRQGDWVSVNIGALVGISFGSNILVFYNAAFNMLPSLRWFTTEKRTALDGRLLRLLVVPDWCSSRTRGISNVKHESVLIVSEECSHKFLETNRVSDLFKFIVVVIAQGDGFGVDCGSTAYSSSPVYIKLQSLNVFVSCFRRETRCCKK